VSYNVATRLDAAILSSDWLDVVWPKSGLLRDPREHPRTNFVVIVKCEHEIRPVVAGERSMRTGRALEPPPDSNQAGKDPSGLRGRPVCSRGLETDIQEFGRGFTVLEAFGDNT
jgi:hypothetical protein